MKTGTVKFFKEDKGWGFIRQHEGGKDIFVHHSGIEGTGFKTLAEGDVVEYAVEQTPKGPAAVCVRKVD